MLAFERVRDHARGLGAVPRCTQLRWWTLSRIATNQCIMVLFEVPVGLNPWLAQRQGCSHVVRPDSAHARFAQGEYMRHLRKRIT